MKTFARNLMKRAPGWLTMPLELIEALDWLEDNGDLIISRTGQPQDHALSLYPAEYRHHPSKSHFAFVGTTLTYTGHWQTPDPAIDARIFEIGETSGDGGRLAIWLDEAGNQQFVHIGHDTLGVIIADPLVLLKFLAMGYPEPGYLPETDKTPLACFLAEQGAERLEDLPVEDRPVFPVGFQTFLKDRFDRDMPATARDLGITNFPEYHNTETTDPFARWVTSITPEPTEADLAYELELMRTVDSLDLKDSDSSDEILQKIGTLFKSKE